MGGGVIMAFTKAEITNLLRVRNAANELVRTEASVLITDGALGERTVNYTVDGSALTTILAITQVDQAAAFIAVVKPQIAASHADWVLEVATPTENLDQETVIATFGESQITSLA